MAATRFGRIVAGDPSLVSDLRRGRRPFGRLRARILAQLGRSPEMAWEFSTALADAGAAAGFTLAGKVEVSPWACLDFVGEQVLCRILATADADRDWAARLPEQDWNLPFLVADLELCWTRDGARVTAVLLPAA